MAPSFEELFELIVRLQKRYPAGSQQQGILNSMMNAALLGTAQPGLFEALKTMEDAIVEQEQEVDNLGLETAIKNSLQQQTEDREAGNQDEEDEEAALQRALELSMQPNDEQDEAADKNHMQDSVQDEETRLALELSMQKDKEEASTHEDSAGLWGILIDSPEESVSPERQRRLASAREGKSWKPSRVGSMQEYNRAGKDEKLSNDTDVIKRLLQAIDLLRSMVEHESPTIRWLDTTIAPRAFEQPYTSLQQVELAIAGQAKSKRARSSSGSGEQSPKRPQPNNDAMERLVSRLEEAMQSLCSSTPLSHVGTEILEHARRLRSHMDGLGSDVSSSAADCNGSLVQLIQLAPQAMSFLIDRPTTQGQRLRFFRLLETARRTAGAYFANIVRRPEEVEGFRLVDALITTAVNEVIADNTLHEGYQVWRTDQERAAATRVGRLRDEDTRQERQTLPKSFMDKEPEDQYKDQNNYGLA